MKEVGRGNAFLRVAQPESYDPDIVEGVARFAWRYGDEIDCIVITGDLATSGLQVDAAVASDLVDASPTDRYFTPNGVTLKPSHRDIHLLAGNHDNYKNDKGEPGGFANFALRFGHRMPNHISGVAHSVLRKGVEQRERYLGIVLADLSLRSAKDCSAINLAEPLLRYGQGRVYSDILYSVQDRTKELRQKYRGIHIVWMIHFAPYDCGLLLQLNDFQDLIESARTLGVSDIICGHTHERRTVSAESLTIHCAGPSGAVGADNSTFVHIHEIEFGASSVGHKRRDFKWHRKIHDFSEVPTR